MRIHHFLAIAAICATGSASAFCGFYVAKADATLFNDRSEVILVRDGQRTIITMSNDFKGNVKDFAMVIPVPTVLQRNDIRIVERRVFGALDAYSAPRLVEYWDDNPCQRWEYAESEMMLDAAPTTSKRMSGNLREKAAKDYGVTIEAQYSVGEYDILILGAKESNGLKQWLLDNGYKIPTTAHDVLDPYIKSGLKFFVVKVDLERMQQSGFEFLRPIQVAFESEKFMLPIRLGMANSSGVQDMIVYAFTRTGRVECVNYRTVKVPSDRNIPLFTKEKFGPFYKDLFDRNWKQEGMNAIALEYAWNVTPSWGGMKCDPCVGPPPMPAEFAEAGVDWASPQGGGGQVFFTRLHVRYGREKFPQDLFFQVTPNTENFQARYILTHPATGDLSCSAGQDYLETLFYKRTREMDELYALTGWDLSNDRKYMEEVKGKISPERRNGLEMPYTPVDGPNDDSGNGGAGSSIPNMIMILGLAGLMIGVFIHRSARAA
ncbi:MAG: DUF2330 domain-containing protein [Flavobacteriales bacterium]|nr:DUF2330 domain-containing protein [Flavobacteriales bacterium]